MFSHSKNIPDKNIHPHPRRNIPSINILRVPLRPYNPTLILWYIDITDTLSNNPNPERKMTTIAVSKEDKKEARKFAAPTGMTRSGTKHESDAEIYHKMLEFYKKHNTPLHTVGKRTYSMDKVVSTGSS